MLDQVKKTKTTSITKNQGIQKSLARWSRLSATVAWVVGMGLALPILPHSAAAGGANAFLVAQKSIHAPSGFNGLCNKYSWVCKSSGHTTLSATDKVDLAKQINRAVNRQVREIEDSVQYGREEHWALPTRRGGDCEDFALLKKKMLVERGVPSQALLIATVLDKRMKSHAVLVLRSAQGDLVLDNLTNRILPWNKTGYTFLKLQNPKALTRWDAVFAGGAFQDRPTASQ